MSASTIPSCPAGVTAEQLSAWRDASLSVAEAHQLEAHAATCPACRARLDDYATIAGSLRAQPVPVPDERLWRGVQARMAVRRHRADRVHASGRLWKSLGAVAAALLLVAGFAQLLHGYLISPAVAVAWKQVNLPKGASLSDSHTLSVSAHDGSTAYICSAPYDVQGTPVPISSVTPIVWVTHDRGAHWSRTAALPTARRDINLCDVTVDDVNPEIALAFVSTAANVNDALSPSAAASEGYATFDGGNTWTRLADPQAFNTVQLDTVDGTTYARRQVQLPVPRNSSGLVAVGAFRLLASDDRMQTWRTIDDQIVSAGAYVSQMWVDPNTGEILAQAGRVPLTQQDQEPPQQLWRSVDGGRTWSILTSPASGRFVVRLPSDGQTWSICQGSYQFGNNGEMNSLRCSQDGGQTWVSRSVYSAPVTGKQPAGKSVTISWPATVFAITSDGALLALGNGPYEPKLYRLPVGSDTWQSLGEVPLRADVSVQYFSAPGGGTLWNVPVGGGYYAPGILAVYVAPYPLPISQQPTATLASTATPQPHPLAWQLAAQQLSSLSPGGLFTVANALTDGNTAYACNAQPSGSTTQYAVWVTHDRAAHWTRTAAIPFTLASASDGQCSLAVDANSAGTVALSVGWQSNRQGVDLSAAATFVTTDGGASWRRLPGSQPSIVEQIASRQGMIYAVRWTGALPPQVPLGLWASGDGMRAWQPIDRGIDVPGGQVEAFWLNASTGDMLARASGTASGSSPLWETADGGQHWTPVNVPEMEGEFEVQTPTGAQPWHICEMYHGNSGIPGEANQLWCTTDGGQHWLERPTLNYTFTCLKCTGAPTPTTQTFFMSLMGITSGGDVLATVEAPAPGSTPVVPAPPSAPQPVPTLYRLPAASTTWQSLGALPPTQEGSFVQYIPAPGNGVLWALGDFPHLYTVTYP